MIRREEILELDGYNHKLRLAFEYNGYQHYDYPNVFHKTREEFYKQRERDRLKAELCKKERNQSHSDPVYREVGGPREIYCK